MTNSNKFIHIIIFIILIFSNGLDISAQQNIECRQNHVIIKFKSDVSKISISELKTNLKASVINKFKIGAELWEVSGISVEQAIKAYSGDPLIEYIEPDYVVHTDEIIPNDPEFSQLWGMHNTGQSDGTVDADIDALEAWSIYTGGDVLIGVIDTGVDYDHIDLSDNMWINPYEIPDDSIDNDNNGFIDDVRGWDFAYNDDDPMDVHGHGTHCSGTITAIGNNGIGVAGVNWSAKIMALKFLNDSGSGSTSDAISALEYATMMGVKITSNSWGGGGYSQALYDAIEAAGTAGALFIAAAGNDTKDTDQTPHYPSSYNLDNIISVASTDHNDLKSSFSNWGAISVDLGAPGSNIYSTIPGNSYGYKSGTSMATPHVSGAISLIWSRVPELNNLTIKEIILNSVDPIAALIGITFTGGRLNVHNALQQANPDSTSPDPVTDLLVTETGSSWLILTWTASGDDSSTGTASFYDIRYSNSEINDGNFNSATQVLDPPSPKESSTSEIYKVDSLNFNTTYFFAIKVFDEQGNPSLVSNSPSGTTQGIPDITVSPDSLSDTLYTGETSIKTLTISNEGEGVLDFSFPNFSASVLLNTPGIQKNQSSDDIPRIEITKGEEDPRVGHPIVLGAGGPDNFGYTWIDSDEPGGPVFTWYDISTIGTNSGLSGDDNSITIDLPFNFKFYGKIKNSVKISTNGYLTFGFDGTDYSNDPIPDSNNPNDFITPFWDDLIGSGYNYYYNEQNKRLIIQYSNWQHINGEGFYDFQVHLCKNGYISFYYYSMTGTINSATIGIENSDASDGLQVVFNNNYVHDSLTVFISTTPEFLSVNPSSGSIQSGSSVDIDVTFDATNLSNGEYDETILISSNDTDKSEITVPIHLHVTGAPDISVNPDTLNFSSTFIGSSDTDTLVISNHGEEISDIIEIASNNADYTSNITSFSLNPAENQVILVTFSPSSNGIIKGILTINSNDPDEPIVTVGMSGEGLTPPDISVSPDSLNETLLIRETSTQILAIDNNSGGSNLGWKIQVAALMSTKKKLYALYSSDYIEHPNYIKVESVDLTDVHILWDMAHGQDSCYDLLSIIVNDLINRGAVVDEQSSIITFPQLVEYDILLTVYPTINWFYNEVTAVTNWVKTGGSLLLAGSDIYSVSTLNNLLSTLGAGIECTTENGIPGITTNILPHETTENVGMIYLDQYTSKLSSVTSPASVLFNDNGDSPNTAYSTSGYGRIIVMSNGILFDSNIDPADNRVFGNQVFDWLAFSDLSWLSVSQESGIIPPDSSKSITVLYNTTDLKSGDYDANIVVSSNDPDKPEITIPVHLEVIEGIEISLNSGWNFVSWNIDTENDSTTALLNPILDSLVVALGFEQRGFTFDPSIPSNLNTLQNMDHFHGYELMMTGSKELTVIGNLVDLQTPIILEENWNLASYLSPHIDSTAHAIASVIDNTIVVLGYDGEGLTFDPTLPPEVNTLNIMKSGFGYWIKTTNKDTLIYPTDFVASQSISKTLAKAANLKIESQNLKPTREWISLWGQDITLDGVLLPVGMLVKAVDKHGVICGECVVHHQGMFGLMSIYRDDPRTEEDEGANTGEEVTIYFGEFKVPETVTWTSFGDVINLSQVLTAIGSELTTVPTKYALQQNYPNPFNPNTTIQYDLPKNTKVTIKIFNILGKEIAIIIDDYQKAGFRKIQWNGKNKNGEYVPSGIYFYTIVTDNFKQTKKLILLR